MGMTDKQFDAYVQSVLRNLAIVKDEVQKSNGESPMLETIIKDMENQLKRP